MTKRAHGSGCWGPPTPRSQHGYTQHPLMECPKVQSRGGPSLLKRNRDAADTTWEGSHASETRGSSAGAGELRELVCRADCAAHRPPGHRLLRLSLHQAPSSQINNTWPSPQTQVAGVQTLASHDGAWGVRAHPSVCVYDTWPCVTLRGYDLGTDTPAHSPSLPCHGGESASTRTKRCAQRENVQLPGWIHKP